MPFYDEKFYSETLMFSDVFFDKADFIAKVGDVGGITDPVKLGELFDILEMKYYQSHTRYTVPSGLIMGIKRELFTAFPFYLKRKELSHEMMDMEIEEIQLGARQLRNLVNTHDEPINNASTIPFDDLSTEQEYVRITNNKLEAVKQKYQVMSKNYLQGIYAQTDGLFRVMLSESVIPIYEQ